MKIINDLFYAEPHDGAHVLDLYLPEHTDHFPLFVYFHGGGLEAGSHRDRHIIALGQYLTDHGIAMMSAEYRIYPSAHYPDFIEDAATAVAYAHQNASRYGRCDKIFVGGSSAGGYLSMMLCFDDRYLTAHGLAPCDLAGFVHDAGQPTVHYNVLRERGLDSRRVLVDEAAPLYHIGMAKAYAPMLIIVSDDDMQNRLEQTTLLRSTLAHFGYDAATIELQIAHGKHNQYCGEYDKDGNNVFATMITPFILKYSK